MTREAGRRARASTMMGEALKVKEEMRAFWFFGFLVILGKSCRSYFLHTKKI